jgi:hypothetical protein
LGETLSNEKVIEKLLCVMLSRPRWKGYVSTLEAMQGVQAAFTSDEVYAHLMSFEETLKQAGEPEHASKIIAFSAHNHPNTSSHN